MLKRHIISHEDLFCWSTLLPKIPLDFLVRSVSTGVESQRGVGAIAV